MITPELRLRILSAVALGIPFLVLTWLGGFWFRIVAVFVSLLIFYEFAGITRLGEREPTERLVGWVTLAVVSVLVLVGWSAWALGALVLGVVVAATAPFRFRQTPWAAFALLYAGLFCVALAALRSDTLFGLYAMFFIVAIVWATDILAYFCGRAIGGRKLAPAISPGKTWSGALFGAAAGVAAGLAVALSLRSGGGGTVPLLAFILSVSSQVGDLTESWIKRRFGVKDSGRLIPGHGGFMDRFDGLVFAVFAAFILASLLPPAGPGGNGSELAARLLGH